MKISVIFLVLLLSGGVFGEEPSEKEKINEGIQEINESEETPDLDALAKKMDEEEAKMDPEQAERERKRKQMIDFKCNPDLPNLSVGDVNLTDANFEQFKKDNDVFIIGISDIQCDRCCITENLLNEIHTPLQTHFNTYKVNRV